MSKENNTGWIVCLDDKEFPELSSILDGSFFWEKETAAIYLQYVMRQNKPYFLNESEDIPEIEILLRDNGYENDKYNIRISHLKVREREDL